MKDGELLWDLADTTAEMNTVRLKQIEIVRKCRENGASWVQIANALGVTRQAARQFFGPLIGKGN